MNRVILQDFALGDLEEGHAFYEPCECGAGDYFFDTIMSEISRLGLQAGHHRKQFGFHKFHSRHFPLIF